MSRRKQAFPVRVEGNRLHLSADSGPSSIPGEPTSDKSLPDKCNSNTPDEDVHDSQPNILSNGEFVVSSAISDEPKTGGLLCDESKTSESEHNEQNFTENETRQQDILPSVKVESPAVLEEDTTASSVCSDSSAVKEGQCTLAATSVSSDSSAVKEEQCTLPATSVCSDSSAVKEEQCTLAATSVCSDSSAVKEEQCTLAATSVCMDSSAVKEEQWHTFCVDIKKQSPGAVNAEEPQPVHQSHGYTNGSCKVGKSAEICRDVNVRTSLVCKAGTEIKIVVNTSAEKVEVQCVTNLTENTFEIHKKPPKQIEGSAQENNTPRQVCTVQEDLESKETVLQDVLPCDEADDKKLESLIFSYMDLVPDAGESNISSSPIDERSRCTGVVSSPEPDSSTILLDECELNIPDESACVGLSHILSDEELIVTGDIYSERNTDILADEEALPPIKVEPCIILKEEQEPLNIPSCIDSSGIKDEGFGTFPAEEEKHSAGVINIQELETPCLSHCHGQCGCKGVAKNSETCSYSNIRFPVTRRVTRQSVRAEKEEAQRLAEFTSKAAEKQLEKPTGSFHKDCSLNFEEQKHACTRPKNILGSEDSPLEAILPCVDIDLSLLKEQEPVVVSSCKSSISATQENTCASFPDSGRVISTSELEPLSLGHGAEVYDHESTESAVEECRDLSVKNRVYRTRNKANQNNYAESDEVDSLTKSKGNTTKAGRKRRYKTRGSRRRGRAPQTKDQNQGYTEPDESQLQAILPCDDVDPSFLKDETEQVIISACKDPIASETNLFILPADEGKQFEYKANTPSEHTEMSCEELEGRTEMSEDSTTSNPESHIPRNGSSRRVKPCVTEEEIRCMVDFTKEALEQREKKLQQIREAVYRKRALESEEQRQARLEKDKLRQRKRRAEETEEQREKRLLTMRLHKRIKRSMNSAPGLQKNFLDYYMEEMFKYPETQEEQGSPLNMIVSIDPSWVLRTVEKQQFKCAAETEEQRRMRLEKDMLRQRKKRAEETPEQRAKRLETMRINKRIRRAMETEEQRLRRLEYSRERQLFRRLNETDDQRKERLEREKLRQREKRAAESSEERALRLRAARERMRMRLSDPSKVTDMIDNLLSSDSLSS